MDSSLSSTLQNVVTDTWVKATWEEFIAWADNPEYDQCKFYYDRGYMRIDMAAVGPRHGRQNSIMAYLVILFASFKNIQIVEFTNTSFRKAGIGEFQPDLAFYIGSGLKVPPDNNSPIDLNEYDPPTLVIEVGATTINDDLGRNRLLYERSGVQEYWVNDANFGEIIAFAITEGRSGEIQESLVLPGLNFALVKEALQRRQTEDDGAITRWLLETFSK